MDQENYLLIAYMWVNTHTNIYPLCPYILRGYSLIWRKSRLQKLSFEPGVVVHTYIFSSKETEAGRSRVQGQPGLHMRPCLKK
jgi:hypothetical protein